MEDFAESGPVILVYVLLVLSYCIPTRWIDNILIWILEVVSVSHRKSLQTHDHHKAGGYTSRKDTNLIRWSFPVYKKSLINAWCVIPKGLSHFPRPDICNPKNHNRPQVFSQCFTIGIWRIWNLTAVRVSLLEPEQTINDCGFIIGSIRLILFILPSLLFQSTTKRT